jgi:hypothetical protein
MGDDTTIDELPNLIRALTTKVIQPKVDGFQKDHSSSGSSGPGGGFGEHHNNRPPRFHKLDFPKFGGKSDPLTFINRCESFFHQQHIVEEEKVWMASFNLQDAAQLWYIQIQHEKGTPQRWRFYGAPKPALRPPSPVQSAGRVGGLHADRLCRRLSGALRSPPASRHHAH